MTDKLTYTISGVDSEKGCVRVEMTLNGFELHEDAYADLTDESAVKAAIEAVVTRFAADIGDRTAVADPPAAAVTALVGREFVFDASLLESAPVEA